MREIVGPAGRVISLGKKEETGVMQRWTAGGPRHVIYSTLVILRRACWPAADQTLFVTGDEGDGCYRVEEGLLKASVAAATGGERILAILGPGSGVGEVSMIDGAPRSASAAAPPHSQLSFVGRAAFEAFVRSTPELFRQMHALPLERL